MAFSLVFMLGIAALVIAFVIIAVALFRNNND